MIIQSGYGIQAYASSIRTAVQQQNSAALQLSSTDSSKNAERVTLSSQGKELAASENGAAAARTPGQEWMLQAARSSPQTAAKLASDMAYIPSGILYDIRDSVENGGPIRLAGSGRVVDDAFKSQFESEAAVIDAQRRALYEAETAKGTDPVQILTMMIDFTNAQSQSYLEGSGWGYRGSSAP
ncbi:hypothetical protein E6C76_14795 [Pseudothauera nasutitermitis]|uniref:Uncharacterized protein n=1 Tax=Pseudothauera nasutitermitis TaxID=2565930 RepID=A0A4S4AX32_9RHOO|nr:hypothetical protein [Pseudothauera nasutitermitis]THF63845.1 hypothetical protein E6C76_14795 [Pseudothauera nasutitermitis]